MRRVRRRGGNKEKVFGCDLLEHLNASGQEIPVVLRCCSEFVEQNGIVDGIYRLSGVSSNIQKLRGEFESEGSPDLNKDVYLQDIHCVSNLCKAYFRELPNPLLTYQLYDKFAEAVAIQLEEERLVKIRDVLKELPTQHYRTLEFLMRHLVRMASYSSDTNMHARNLAIVWAPNLLRSKDIEASGFNGTAAFMEVRVQSIVVEFILTHVPQLFPEQGVSNERRKSLPSPSAMPNPDEGFFRPVPTPAFASIGNISPGDGPLPIRPYHAIIEGTDKRKGSLKGRKWMSIFNIGGRFHDQRRRHKHAAKEKDRASLRPARSMDSLSTPSYPKEGLRHPAPPISTTPVITPSPQSAPDNTIPASAIGGSEYAVTYRRGTGLVSGNVGTQGTYTALDPEGLGIGGNETLQSRSPGVSTKVGRRAAMHITGPTVVTVPLHITSNLALGMLQGGGSDRVILRSRDKDGGDKVEGKVGVDKVEKKESRGAEDKKLEKEEKFKHEKNREGIVDLESDMVTGGGAEEEKNEEAEEEETEEEKRDCRRRKDQVMGGRSTSREQQTKSLNSHADQDNEDADDNDGYMEMKGGEPAVSQHGDDGVFDASDFLNSTEVEAAVEGDDQELSGYVQDNFEFLDEMDCSVLDGMDCSVPYQVKEFSVEPPGHSDDEYEDMEHAQPSHPPTEPQTHLQPRPETRSKSHSESNPHRPLSADMHSRHIKSLSLPFMTPSVYRPEDSSSEEEAAEDDSDDNDYSSVEDESMFVKSLPSDFFLTEFEGDIEAQDSFTHHKAPLVDHLWISEETDYLQHSSCKETTTGEHEQVDVNNRENKDGLGETEEANKEADDEDQLENDTHSYSREEYLGIINDAHSEKSVPSEELTPWCLEFPLPGNEDADESSSVADKNKVVEISPNANVCTTEKETDDPSKEEKDFSLVSTEHISKEKDTEDDSRQYKEAEDMCEEIVLEIHESDDNMLEESTDAGDEMKADKSHERMIGDKENEQRDGVEMVEDNQDEEELTVKVLGEENEAEGRVTNEGEVRIEGGKGSLERAEENLSNSEMPQKFEDEAYLRKRRESGKVNQEVSCSNKAEHHVGEEVVSEQPQKENNDSESSDEARRALTDEDKQFIEFRTDMKESRECEKGDSSLEGVGRKLVIAKHPKIHQVKAVPVVPPKPQHCKITALTIRHQQLQRERRDAEKGRAPMEQDRACDGDEKMEKPALRGGERRWDGLEGAARDTRRNSPLSMCFDEAVAIETMRREKERVREGEGESEGLGK
ncbi:uncharacterized protein KZ484_020765 [Pholidichthys leucotaenia]